VTNWASVNSVCLLPAMRGGTISGNRDRRALSPAQTFSMELYTITTEKRSARPHRAQYSCYDICFDTIRVSQFRAS
jgi:hypothetical protein